MFGIHGMKEKGVVLAISTKEKQQDLGCSRRCLKIWLLTSPTALP